MAEIQFGWVAPAGSRQKAGGEQYMSDVRRGLELVSGHFDSAWVVDHLQFDNNDVLEGWTLLTYMAALAPELKFGHAVLCQSFRNPGLTAKMAATFQYVSGGRFILGLGAGWKEDEYEAYNYPFPPAGVRVEQLDEYLQVIKALWREERATFEGKHYSVREAWFEPKPKPEPTIMIGAMKPKMIQLTARHADWWNVSWTPIDEYRKEVQVCEAACAEIGRDPQTLRRTWFGGCAVAPTEREVEEIAQGRLKAGNAFVGTPEQVIEQMRPFVELGVDYFMLGSGGFPNLVTPELLIKEVLPAVRSLQK